VGGAEVVGRSGDGVLNEGNPKGDNTCPLGGGPHDIDDDQYPDLSMGEECLQADLDTGVREDAKSLDPKVARILPKAVAATWEVHQLWEILPTASSIPGYSKKPVTQKRPSHV
jgi:hypothetical protein